ncbi:hypothetical protein FS749_016597 [Ceratobasidium sp. UAMH 11750]|nr:hypothetical protein FS749_016597 [Ceratobasidium sp. UAMH 11750]
MEALILFGLLDLLKRDSIPIPEGSELVTITQALRHFWPRPNVLTIHNLPEQTLDSYFKNHIEPHITPESDGTFMNSETIRAAYLSVVTGNFLENLESPKMIHILGLALENLSLAQSSNLKQACCDVLHYVPIYDISTIACRDQSRLLKLLLCGLELNREFLHSRLSVIAITNFIRRHCSGANRANGKSAMQKLPNDDRALPYLMAVIWGITQRILKSDLPATEKHDILGPVLPRELFLEAEQTQSDPGSAPQSLFEMGEVWLHRLEKMHGVALSHTRRTIIFSLLSDIFQHDSDHARELENRLSALIDRSDAFYKCDPDRPLWSEDSEDDV